jgi:pyruvate formate lyase activating enzyme
MFDGPGRGGVVYNVMRFAVHDGPGIRTIVFFKGCPLDCWWCHNPEGQSGRPQPRYFEERCRHCGECVAVCPQAAIATPGATDLARCTRCGMCMEQCCAAAREICGRQVGVAELVAEIERDVVFFDDSGGGVTLSGGEPLAQPRFALTLLRACRERRIHTTVETCGLAHPLIFQTVVQEAALVLFDLKLLDRGRHRHYTGVFNDSILRNLETLAARSERFVVRIPVVPGVNDSDQDAAGFARHLSRLQVPAVELLPYHRIGTEKYRRLGMPLRFVSEPPAMERIERFAQPLRRAGLSVRIGG